MFLLFLFIYFFGRATFDIGKLILHVARSSDKLKERHPGHIRRRSFTFNLLVPFSL
jgi:hypothetical protein